MPLSAGDKHGPYEILSPLGAGGMGEVYCARDSRLGRDVALKVLPQEVSNDTARRQRFEGEARAVAALNHPNIVSVYDVAFEDKTAFIVSELVPGETIRRIIERGPMPVRKVLDISMQIADGLAAAHAVSIVHRDLKPDNVMLTPASRVKILDFGLAKSIGRPAQSDATRTIALSQPGSLVGTVSYMSPEQASGSDRLDGRSDQFSLGLMMHEMITGRKAFDRPTAAETMAAIIREDPPPLPDSLRGPLRWTIERCLAKEPAQRFDATRDLFLELRQMLETERRTLGPEHSDTLSSQITLGDTLKFEKRYAEAEKVYRETLEARRRVLGDGHPDVTITAFYFAEVLAMDGKADEALSHLKFAVAHALSSELRVALEKDDDFNSLRGDPRFEALVVSSRQVATPQKTK